MENIFGRINDQGNVNVLDSDGYPVTRMDDCTIYPIDSQTSVCYEHPDGIVITKEDAEKIGLEIE